MKSSKLSDGDGKSDGHSRAVAIANDLPLPPHAHVPGANARPDEAFFEPVKAMVLPQTTHETAHANIAWHYGLRLIGAGFYWEAHEVLEPVWMNAVPNSRERHLVQGVIHLANAALKQKMTRPKAADRLFELARDCFERAFVNDATGEVRFLMGLDHADLEQVCRTRKVDDNPKKFKNAL